MKIHSQKVPHKNNLFTSALLDYIKKHSLQRLCAANDPAREFDILSDIWQLGTKDNLNLEFMNSFDIPLQTWISLRLIIADKAGKNKFGTVRKLTTAIKNVGNDWQDILSFQATFHGLTDGSKRVLLSYFNMLNESHLNELQLVKEHFAQIIKFLVKQDYPNNKRLRGVFDPVKGVYTDEEMDDIYEKLRLKVSDLLSQLNKDTVPSLAAFFMFSNTISLLLLICIYRRPVQLSMMKWSDILPVGASFKDHRYAVHSPAPIEESEFSDLGQIHLRTFKGKSSYGFREYAEHRSHRMEPEFSKLIGIYRYFYNLLLMDRLRKQGIELNKEEQEDLLYRCPLFPGQELFTTQYRTKRNLFLTLGHMSDVMHRNSTNLRSGMERVSISLELSSSRIASFNVSNNRSRHTVITNAIEHGRSTIQAAAITGVTPDTIKEYMQLDIKGRLAINEAMAGHRILGQFARISLNDIANMDGYTTKNEFDEIQGILKNNTPCITCMTNICKPIGCYGCDNFTPYIEADHEANLTKIEQKISFNEEGNPDKGTLKKLQTSRLYCKATISMINEVKLRIKGVKNVD